MKHRERGSEVLEFALVIIPFLAMVSILLNVAWTIFSKTSLEWAVRRAVDQGTVMTQTQIATYGSTACLTDAVKQVVEQSSFGMLTGTAGLSQIKVHYFEPPASGSTTAATDVSGDSDADTAGNIMQVSVQNYSIMPLLPRIVNLNTAPDNNPMVVSVYAAGVIQLSSDPPSCVGTAP